MEKPCCCDKEQKEEGKTDSGDAKPECRSCKTGICSPCLIVWGVFLIVLLASYLLGH